MSQTIEPFSSTQQTRRSILLTQIVLFLILSILWLSCTHFASRLPYSKTAIRIAQNNDPTLLFNHLATRCANVSPITISEFHDRHKSLAKILHTLNVSAYIAEPGANTDFFGNISTSHWYLSERPLLLIITPSPAGDHVEAKVFILTPKFEAARARALPIPADVRYIEWPEEADPYRIAASVITDTAGTIFVDSAIRKFLVDGLHKALPHATIASAPLQITQLRERKSAAELDLLKCANEATLLAIREVHKQLYIGIHESVASEMLANALAAAGLKNGNCLTLFGDNAALPHGRGTDRALGKTDFALFDCTGSLHGYYSDVTRTVALPDSEIPDEHIRIWNYVHSAQTIAFHKAHEGVLTRAVDEATRSFLKIAGYDSYFPHRLGHGIGLEVHEQPYLRGGSDVLIKTGHTFSNEPGIYIENKAGVRIEDCFFINQEGSPTFLTAGVGGQSISPWLP